MISNLAVTKHIPDRLETLTNDVYSYLNEIMYENNEEKIKVLEEVIYCLRMDLVNLRLDKLENKLETSNTSQAKNLVKSESKTAPTTVVEPYLYQPYRETCP